mmetsp:Transcript_120663/g.341850  ORF Transcript_120663/g.341850 Transcript_120663/m.341850 type:complete len:201 (-) Transcript_120663:163-765(-)
MTTTIAVLPTRLNEFLLSAPFWRKASIVIIARCSDLPRRLVGSAGCSVSPPPLGATSSGWASASFALDSLAVQAESIFGNSLDTIAETCAPPCPSKTANMAWSDNGEGSDATAQVASSIAGRHPCISDDAHSSVALFPPSVFFWRRGARTGPATLVPASCCASFTTMTQTVTVMTPFRVKSCKRSLPGICSKRRMINRTT